jgi:uncharacterized alpha/beta hydrolase family protein
MCRQAIFQRLVMVTFIITISSCTFSKLGDDIKSISEASHVFSGTVSSSDPETNNIVVLALRDKQGDMIAATSLTLRPGPFEIQSKPEPTWIFAFNDLNESFSFQEDEPYGWANAGGSIEPADAANEHIDIEIVAASDNLEAAPTGVINNSLFNNLRDFAQLNFGTVSSLDEAKFSHEMSKKGLWQPFTYLADGSTGIHFIEEFKADLIPVLFVHGAQGTPRNFTDLIKSLDRSKYQAWVFNYPSGFSLSVLDKGLYQLMELVQNKYDVKQLHVVAHSMGGLVSRGALNICAQKETCEYLRSFTTISTPWNGVASVSIGIEWGPKVVPVWRDLEPDSEYLKVLFEQPLPKSLPHRLIFGFRQDKFLTSGSSDGVISLGSQLRLVAQQQATLIRGYDEGHVTILSNPSVIEQVNAILAANSQ